MSLHIVARVGFERVVDKPALSVQGRDAVSAWVVGESSGAYCSSQGVEFVDWCSVCLSQWVSIGFAVG